METLEYYDGLFVLTPAIFLYSFCGVDTKDLTSHMFKFYDYNMVLLVSQFICPVIPPMELMELWKSISHTPNWNL